LLTIDVFLTSNSTDGIVSQQNIKKCIVNIAIIRNIQSVDYCFNYPTHELTVAPL
jgi:hypothetical protein